MDVTCKAFDYSLCHERLFCRSCPRVLGMEINVTCSNRWGIFKHKYIMKA